MTTSHIPDFLQAAEDDLDRSNIRRALGLLRAVAKRLNCPEISKDIDKVEGRYFYMLRFLYGNPSSAQDAEIKVITDTITDIIAALSHHFDAQGDTLYGAQIRFEELRPEENLQSIISDYLSEAERLRTDTAALTNPRSRAMLERLANDIFNRLWTVGKLDQDTADLVIDLIGDDGIRAAHRELWVNGIGMALAHRQNDEVLRMLYTIAGNNNRRISIAAAIWLLITLLCMKENLPLGESEQVWHIVTETAGLDALGIYKIIVQNFTSENGDFFNDIASLSQRFKGINPTNPGELKNLDLGSDDYDKLRRFNEAQANGADVFIKSIGRMRQYPFFATLANWFMPFDPQHSALAEITDGEGAEIAESIARMPNRADSDKYAVLLSMSQMPPSMRNTTLSAMVDSMRMMSDMPEYNEAMKEFANISDRALVANQLHGIARFCKYFPKVDEFKFTLRWTPYFMLYFDEVAKIFDNAQIIELANFAVKHGFRHEAMRYFDIISHTDDGTMTDEDYETYADLLVENQSTNQDNLDKAIDIYRQLLSEDAARIDIALKLAKVFRELSLVRESIETLINAGVEGSNNIEALKLLAECYLTTNQVDEAIETLHQADYLLPADDNSAKLSLAYAYMLGNYPDEAAGTISLIAPEQRDSKFPGLERIILWLTGHPDEAVETDLSGDDLDRFLNQLSNSIESLWSYPIGETKAYTGLKTLPDIMAYRAKGSQFGNL